MREIKFRAWEKSLKQIIPVDNIDFEKRMVNTESVWRMFDEIELMQYTGLKDKNDKEIYEGDIVEIHDGTITAFRTSGKHIIEWWNGQFVFQANSHEEDDYINFGWWVRSNNHSASLKQIEVIGNIYENPEPIEKAQA